MAERRTLMNMFGLLTRGKTEVGMPAVPASEPENPMAQLEALAAQQQAVSAAVKTDPLQRVDSMPALRFNTILGLDALDEVSTVQVAQNHTAQNVVTALDVAVLGRSSHEPTSTTPGHVATQTGMPHFRFDLSVDDGVSRVDDSTPLDWQSPETERAIISAVKRVIETPKAEEKLPLLSDLVDELMRDESLREYMNQPPEVIAFMARRMFNYEILNLINTRINLASKPLLATERVDSTLLPQTVRSLADPTNEKKYEMRYKVARPFKIGMGQGTEAVVTLYRNFNQVFQNEMDGTSENEASLIIHSDVYFSFSRPLFAAPDTRGQNGYQHMVVSNGSHRSLLGQARRNAVVRHANDPKLQAVQAHDDEEVRRLGFEHSDIPALVTTSRPAPDLEVVFLHPGMIDLMKGRQEETDGSSEVKKPPVNTLFNATSWAKEFIRRDAVLMLALMFWLRKGLKDT